MKRRRTTGMVTLRSQARTWQHLDAFLQEALFEAQHGPAGLAGGSPRLVLVLSGALLAVRGPEADREVRILSLRLAEQDVWHAIHRLPADSPQPATHTVRISID